LPTPWDLSGVNLRTALYYSLKFNNKRTALALLQAKVVLCPVLFKTFPPLHIAASNGDLDIIRFLVTLDGTSLAVRNVVGQTALHFAAASGRDTSVTLLRALGAKAHLVDDFTGTRMRNYAARWLALAAPGAPCVAVWQKLLNDAVEDIEAVPAA